MKPAFDRESLLLRVPGDALVSEMAAFARAHGVELLHAAPDTMTVDAWIAAGAPGARDRFLDPADQLLAGAMLRLVNGDVIELRPAPRRSVGPDLVALVFGQRGRFATIVHADLRVHFPGTLYTSPFHHADPAIEKGEARLFDELAKAFER